MNKRIFKKHLINKGYRIKNIKKGWYINNLVYVQFFKNKATIEYAYHTKEYGVNMETINLDRLLLQKQTTKSFFDSINSILNATNVISTVI